MDEDDIIRLTVKGWLVGRLGEDAGVMLWDELEAFVKGSMDYDEDRGEPAILLRGGGVVVGLEESE